MGFGHRVYKNVDPRAKLMHETCHEVLNELGLHNDRLFKLALQLEKIALEDDYFIRKLYRMSILFRYHFNAHWGFQPVCLPPFCDGANHRLGSAME